MSTVYIRPTNASTNKAHQCQSTNKAHQRQSTTNETQNGPLLVVEPDGNKTTVHKTLLILII